MDISEWAIQWLQEFTEEFTKLVMEKSATNDKEN